ncbi:ABC transporter permease [Salaquimonas pukyongi]|uniref:ABC transporter permease n=1 Tax=Salaquimonas pukyongi TaxID=2712698 RepID=UPI00096BA000|nr:ABC transporter permease [Salaquimonas pukyongi]
MSYFVFRRLLSLILTLLLATIVIFAVLEVVPGDPARLMLGINATEDAVAALREQLGLNQPLLTRYFSWVAGLLQGDLGQSFTYSSSVTELIGERIWVSLPLALMALSLSTLIAIPVGLYAAARRGKASDTTIMAASQFGIAIPNFWFALLLVYVFAVLLRWVPAGGFPGWQAGFWPALKSLALPAIALALPQAAILSRVARSALIEVLGEDFIRTARAKGLTRSQTLWHHALRNALIPVVTIMGLQFAFLLAGTIIIENVFYLPGLGRLVFQAITQHDLPVVQGTVLLLVASVVLTNFLVDLVYAWIDPRLRKAAR